MFEDGVHSLLNPILVRPEQDGTFTTLAGSRRLKACRELGHKTIPALVIDGDPLPLARKRDLAQLELTKGAYSRRLVRTLS